MPILQVATAAGRRVRKVLVVDLLTDDSVARESPSGTDAWGPGARRSTTAPADPIRRPRWGSTVQTRETMRALPPAREPGSFAGLEAKTAAEESLLARR